MQGWKKFLIGVSASIVLIIIVVFLLSYITLLNSLPLYEGEVSVIGLKNKVVVYRDSFAVPMIIAEDEEDAAFALGFIHAQERLFQMDIARRAGEGRLSEVMGSKTLAIDKMFRTVGIYKKVKNDYNKINSLSKRILDAYSSGVNEFIKEAKGKFQIEFDVLGYDPYPWKPEHSMLIGKLMGWELNISFWSDLAFSNIVQKLGEEKARELLPSFPQNAPTIIPSYIKTFANIPKGLIDVDKQYRELTGFVGTHIGSNNWVVNGLLSASGKPIIANDPHLSFAAPGKWFFVSIKSEGWNVEGFTIPGLPAVIIGKNENIAWAVTNVMADDMDFYSEKIDSSSENYFFNNEWKNLFREKDSIAVKDSLHYVFEIKSTHRGPIISDIHPVNRSTGSKNEVSSILSMKWTGLEFSDEIFAGLLINKSKDWKDFQEALKRFTVPGQNFIYADKEGNIGYVCAARLPIRNSESPTLVYDGTKEMYDWKGFVPYEEMPKLYNPVQNFIATANNKTVENFKYHISNIWEPASRIERITELLKSKKNHSVEDYKKYQNDLESPYAKFLTGYIVNAFTNVKVNDVNLKTALEILNNWDFNLNTKSQVPTIYAAFLHHLIKNIFEDELGEDLIKEYVFIANIPYRKIQEILESNNSIFFDDINTPQFETRDDMIRKSLVDALTFLEKNYGKEIKNWQWGEIHKVTFKHMFNGFSSFTDRLVNIGPYEIGGDGTTIFNTEYSFNKLFNLAENKKGEAYSTILGPSMRYIFDFADPDYLEFILPTGQSGNFISPHYKDMTQLWLEGKYHRVPVTKDSFIEKSLYKLRLITN